ncbi:hypothetical protein, variant [Aphanomyces invadans]|uniref:PPM-type phosphatase domain-containing protein n=1 Tax=Aphanomyces invadans TaxID=157072 RepID=A0A024TM79_9STRA|nr:hypothetical protein, variant [Aphanomyces invadans]ETV95104.1 hypothetical protein, variant [Aphanomyces invadans]|eukprot:XP_008876276.1 hypothetical protein, variant [Aphanomyces invadans]
MVVIQRMIQHLRARVRLPPSATSHFIPRSSRNSVETPRSRRVSVTRAAGVVAVMGLLYDQATLMEPRPLTLDRKTTRLVPVQMRKRTSKADSPLLVSASAVRGDRPTMEDALFIAPNRRFTAVFDGHGGADVSSYLKANLYDHILANLGPAKDTWNLDEIETSLRDAFRTVDAVILERREWIAQGSTATAVLLMDDLIWSMNVGDSRAVLCRNGRAVNLTRDHKPNDPMERSRVEKAGGRVQWHGLRDPHGRPIVDMGAYRINSNLAVARAFGDGDQRPYVSGEMELKCFRRDPSDKFIVVASDGLWDVFTSAEVVMFVRDVLAGEVGSRESWRSGSHAETSVELFEWRQMYKNDSDMIQAALATRKEQMAKYLTQEALFRGTADNVAVVVIWLDKVK